MFLTNFHFNLFPKTLNYFKLLEIKVPQKVRQEKEVKLFFMKTFFVKETIFLLKKI